MNSNYRKKGFSIILQILLIITIIVKLIIDFQNHSKHEEFTNLAYVKFLYLILVQCTGLFFKNILFSSISVGLFWVILIFTSSVSFVVEKVIFTIAFLITMLIVSFYREKNLLKFFKIEENSKSELNKIETLLTQMMPPHVFQNLREEIAIADSFQNVTILYADIVGFTAWSSNKESKEVVGMLSEFFTRFDKMCVEFDVYKVHTIGDCYVAIGLNGSEFERNPSKECLNMINFAKSLLDIIDVVNSDLFLNLSMRIGIHTGNIIGGIAGAKVIRYDIYGSDVLIANKMESNGVAGSIVMSEETLSMIEDFQPDLFEFEFYKEVPIPSIDKTIKAYKLL